MPSDQIHIDAYGWSDSHTAARYDDKESLLNLIANNGLNALPKYCDYITPLHIAARYGKLDIIKILYEHYSSYLANNIMDNNILQNCGISSRQLCSNANIKCAPAINSCQEMGEYPGIHSPLHEAAKFSQTKAIEFLFMHGADFNQKDSENRTPLDVAGNSETKSYIENLISLCGEPGNSPKLDSIMAD